MHLDPYQPRTIKQEEIFKEDNKISKTQDGFALINYEIFNERNKVMELRHLVFGLNNKCNQIFEFDRDEDEEFELLNSNTSKF